MAGVSNFSAYVCNYVQFYRIYAAYAVEKSAWDTVSMLLLRESPCTNKPNTESVLGVDSVLSTQYSGQV